MKLLHVRGLLILWLWVGLFSLSGCSEEDYELPVSGQLNELKLFYQHEADTEVLTRTQTADEVKINKIYAIFYNYSADTEAARTYAGVAEATDMVPSGGSGLATFQLPSDLDASKSYHIYVLTNIDNYVSKGSSATVEAWLKSALSSSSATFSQAEGILEAVISSAGIAGDDLPMFGKTVKTSAGSLISVMLTRLVARIDVTSTVDAATFDLESVQVYNARKHSKLLTGSSLDLSSDAFVESFDAAVVYDVTAKELKNKIYVLPNYQAATSKGDKVTTCLIVKGKYNGGTSSYYRLNVKPKTGSQALKPNHRYKIKITGVSGAGSEKPGDAYGESDAKISYDINDWKEGDMGDGASDENGNRLDVSPRQVVFSYLKGQKATINLLKTENTNLGAITLTSSDSDNFGAKLINSNTQVEIEVLTDNYGNTDREAYIMVKWGSMEVPVYITQLGATSTAGGLRVAPNSLRFGATANFQIATLAVSGDLSGVNVSQISFQVMKTENDLEAGNDWCTINGATSGNNGAGFTAKSGTNGLFDFQVDVTAMDPNAKYARSAIIYFTLTKPNGEILNATMSVRQAPGSGGGNTDKLAITLFEWTKNDTNYPAADSDVGYANQAINGFDTNIFRGFPTDKVGLNHLHFSVVEHKTLKYRIAIPMDKSWRIIVKGNAVGKIAFTATTSTDPVAIAANGNVWVTATSDPIATWTDGSFVIEYGDGTESEFFVYQMGIVSRLKNAIQHNATELNGKIFYYGVMTINGVTWLDRNLGASDNGYFSTYDTGVTGTKEEKNRGAFFESVVKAEAACPAGFRLPTFDLKAGETEDTNSDNEWGYVYRHAQWTKAAGMQVNGKTYKYSWYISMNSSGESWLIPLSGYGYGPAGGNGHYWFSKGYVYFYATSESKSRGTGQSNTNGFSARCVRK
ncbi:DUF4906 domain-containing protein [Bacteroides sp. 224]|uniref:DUF4906 domain-containing protein n=1 Tax=Bacteroides sp. 224 TaxID=2302936 RepID=UPI0013D3CC9C|nr:DUF4906 domain-containing protein [Bacteroides sp. 224]NDV66418.1 DUF4906 domain-containing protein [Bacteroides sp. 224]